MRVIVVDTETTGLPDFKQPPHHESQPHLVQLAWLLAVDGRVTRARCDIVLPDGWEIPQPMAAIHGITTAFAKEHGDHADVVIGRLEDALEDAEVFVAHNVHFDRRILETTAHRCTNGFDSPLLKLRETHRLECTQAGNAKVVKARQASGAGKFASLDETHAHYFGAPLRREGQAHDALDDALACWRVWCAMQPKAAP